MTGRASMGLALLAVLALPASADAGSRSEGTVRLSDGRTFAHWAHPQGRAPVRRLPARTSRRVARLHLLTEDGFPEVYPALRRVTGHDGLTWVRVRIPGRPNGRTGWVRDTALGPLYRVRTRLVVDRSHLRATLLRSGKPMWRSRIGIGRAGTPTPAGHFWIREKFRVSRPDGPY
ncbi:MAG: L,D-transpeptidase, partial [Actinobacteria bacterium]|nr:L,D-transpeptidase [Actinomycetota bacterium]